MCESTMRSIARIGMIAFCGLALVQAVGTGRSQAAGADPDESTWNKIASVLQHPRCVNCHQLETPLQGDTRRIHIPPVRRGPDGMGVGTMRCYNCHNESGNNQMAGVPGAPGWRLAPVSMLWQGLSTADLCRMLTDPESNGHRSPQAIIEHMETEKLVLWGWSPGGNREPVPISHGDFVKLMKAWVAGGTVCPQ
jgi:hypothetical protein